MMLTQLKKGMVVFSCAIFLVGCSMKSSDWISKSFEMIFIVPMQRLLTLFSSWGGGHFGFGIIVLVLLVRLCLLPFMVRQSKMSHRLRHIKPVVAPLINERKKKLKEAETPEEKEIAHQKLMKKYKLYGMHPSQTMLGCLPVLLQIPILLGLLYAIKHPSHHILMTEMMFLGYDLRHPELVLTFLAGLLYFIQPLVNMGNFQHKRVSIILAILMPLFIILAAMQTPSAIALYWITNASFLIVQMACTNIIFGKRAQREAIILERNLNTKTDESK